MIAHVKRGTGHPRFDSTEASIGHAAVRGAIIGYFVVLTLVSALVFTTAGVGFGVALAVGAYVAIWGGPGWGGMVAAQKHADRLDEDLRRQPWRRPSSPTDGSSTTTGWNRGRTPSTRPSRRRPPAPETARPGSWTSARVRRSSPSPHHRTVGSPTPTSAMASVPRTTRPASTVSPDVRGTGSWARPGVRSEGRHTIPPLQEYREGLPMEDS